MAVTVIERNFNGGWQSPVRLYSDQILRFVVHFDQNDLPDEVVAYTNLYKSSAYEQLPMESLGEGKYVCAPDCIKSGAFGLRIKWKKNDKWFWDRFPPTRILIDPANLKQICAYTLIPRASGDIRQWRGWLEHAKNLGFNAVHLLPITQPGSSGSPYAASDLFAIDHDVLTIEGHRAPWAEWSQFVDYSASIGIRLCIDLVLNHVSTDSQLCKSRPELFVPDPSEKNGVKRAGWWAGDNWNKWDDLALLHYQHPDVEKRLEIWEIMRDYAVLWAEAAHLTGGFLRLDNFHSSDPSFIRYLLLSLRRKYPELGIYTEFFAPPAIVARKSLRLGVNLQLATPWEEKFVPGLRNLFRYLHSEYPKQRFFTPITSHDSGSPAQEFGVSASIYPRYALSVLGGMGVSGMVQGVEFGLKEKLGFLPQAREAEIHGENDYGEYIRKINTLFFNYERFFSLAKNMQFVDGDHHAVMAFFRTCREDSVHPFFVVLNFDTHHWQSVTLNVLPENVPLPHRIRDRFSGREQEFLGLPWTIDIEPCGVKIIQWN